MFILCTLTARNKSDIKEIFMINIKKTFLELIASYIVIIVISFASETENNVVITAMAEGRKC